MSSTLITSCFLDKPFRVGLAADDLRTGGGLLLGAIPAWELLVGLESKAAEDFMGVFPNSTNFQNGAGELVGMTWLGRCAVLGGARRGWTR